MPSGPQKDSHVVHHLHSHSPSLSARPYPPIGCCTCTSRRLISGWRIYVFVASGTAIWGGAGAGWASNTSYPRGQHGGEQKHGIVRSLEACHYIARQVEMDRLQAKQGTARLRMHALEGERVAVGKAIDTTASLVEYQLVERRRNDEGNCEGNGERNGNGTEDLRHRDPATQRPETCWWVGSVPRDCAFPFVYLPCHASFFEDDWGEIWGYPISTAGCRTALRKIAGRGSRMKTQQLCHYPFGQDVAG